MENKILHRQIDRLEIRAKSEEERMVEFVASTSSVDSYGTVIPVDKWDLSRYATNGVVGYQHDIYMSDDPDNVIGRGEAFIDGDVLAIRIFFEPADINPKAEKVYKKVLFGSINSVSVGFAPTAAGHWGRKEDGENADVYYFNGQELLEVSVVNIPSNPDATKRSIAEERELHEQDRPKEEPQEEEKRSEEAQADPDDSHIRLTLARAKRLLA